MLSGTGRVQEPHTLQASAVLLCGGARGVGQHSLAGVGAVETGGVCAQQPPCEEKPGCGDQTML